MEEEESRRTLRRTERKRSHLNDPEPEKWTFWNIWVFGKHLPISWGIILTTLFLTIIGTLMVYSASSYEMGLKSDSMSEFKTQIAGVILGGGAFFFAANMDYRFLRQKKLITIIMGATAVMLFLVIALPRVPAINKLKIGVWSPYVNDAYRWLYFGFKKGISVQPSEILKIAVVLYLAKYMDDKHDTMKYFWRTNLGALMVVGALTVLLLFQPNLSTACLIVFVTIFMMVAGGMRMSTLCIGLVIAVAGFYVLARYVIEDRWVRIVSFMDPFAEENISGKSYQLVQSFYALGNGGWFGTGLGFSKQKHLFLPYAYSDFIYAIVGEELGFIRGVGILLVFLLLIYFGLRTAIRAQDRFGCYLALGLTSIMGVQVILNVLVVTGLAPTTGIPLPFFTSGGTNITIFLGSMGLLTAVSRRPRPEKEHVLPPVLHRVATKVNASRR